MGVTLMKTPSMETIKPKHIFIVENNKIFVNLLDYIFSKNISYRFMDFNSGESCLKNLHVNPEVVVLDYQLTGMNGFETLQEIREQNREVYVLSLISEKDGKLPAELLNAGANDYILKDGREVEKIVEKLEERFSTESTSTAEVPVKIRASSFRKKLYYALLILLLASAGVYYSQ
jgi:DNA-binding NarL/FixJ family response regulator